MSSSNWCFLTCIQISQEAGKVVWYSHLLNNFPQFVVIHTKILAVKRLSTMWETRIQSLGQEDLLEKVMATHSTILAWRIPWTEEPVGHGPWGHKEWDTTEAT